MNIGIVWFLGFTVFNYVFWYLQTFSHTELQNAIWIIPKSIASIYQMYSSDLCALAQTWADYLLESNTTGHSPNDHRSGAGENIAEMQGSSPNLDYEGKSTWCRIHLIYWSNWLWYNSYCVLQFSMRKSLKIPKDVIGVISGAGGAYSSRAFTRGFWWGSCGSIFCSLCSLL
jgi:hypothetical protein